MRAPKLLSLLLAPALAACGPEFTPRSVLFDLRVLAIVADPLELGLDESVTLRAERFVPAGQAIVEESWTFCPFSVGAIAGYACAVPACEVDLPTTAVATSGPSAEVTASPGALAAECLASLGGAGALPPGIPAELPEKVDVLFRYVATASDGTTREAVQRVPVYPGGAPADRNVPPTIASVEIAGATVDPGALAPAALVPGGELPIVANVAGAQQYVDGDRTLTETLVVSFYTTAGRFDFDRANGPAASVTLEHDEIAGETEAEIWVVARDLRGGQAVGGPYRIAIGSPPPAAAPPAGGAAR